MSWPGVDPVIKNQRKASTPYFSITSIGSIPFPSDLDILRPCSSRISPCKRTCLNGALPVNSSDWKIIRETQKKIMSYPVTRVLVGK